IFLRGSGAGEDDDLGWGYESGGGETPARDEAGRAAGDLPHRGREERGRDSVGRGGRCERRQESAGEDQGWEDDRKAEDAGGNQDAGRVCRVSVGEAGTAERGAVGGSAIRVAGGGVSGPGNNFLAANDLEANDRL